MQIENKPFQSAYLAENLTHHGDLRTHGPLIVCDAGQQGFSKEHIKRGPQCYTMNVNPGVKDGMFQEDFVPYPSFPLCIVLNRVKKVLLIDFYWFMIGRGCGI